MKEKNKNKEANKQNKEVQKTPKKSFSFRFKRWFFGIGKEFSRITWPTKSRVFKDLFVTIVIVVLLALLYLGFDQISGLIK